MPGDIVAFVTSLESRLAVLLDAKVYFEKVKNVNTDR